MNYVTYAITEEKYILDNESIIAYGIAAYADAKQDGTAIVVASIHDITPNKEQLSQLVNDCNRLQLSAAQLPDVVEDFLLD